MKNFSWVTLTSDPDTILLSNSQKDYLYPPRISRQKSSSGVTPYPKLEVCGEILDKYLHPHTPWVPEEDEIVLVSDANFKTRITEGLVVERKGFLLTVRCQITGRELTTNTHHVHPFQAGSLFQKQTQKLVWTRISYRDGSSIIGRRYEGKELLLPPCLNIYGNVLDETQTFRSAECTVEPAYLNHKAVVISNSIHDKIHTRLGNTYKLAHRSVVVYSCEGRWYFGELSDVTPTWAHYKIQDMEQAAKELKPGDLIRLLPASPFAELIGKVHRNSGTLLCSKLVNNSCHTLVDTCLRGPVSLLQDKDILPYLVRKWTPKPNDIVTVLTEDGMRVSGQIKKSNTEGKWVDFGEGKLYYDSCEPCFDRNVLAKRPNVIVHHQGTRPSIKDRVDSLISLLEQHVS